MSNQDEHEFWRWSRCKTEVRSLKGRLGFKESSTLQFLGLSLSLEDGSVHDDIRNRPLPEAASTIYCILSRYAKTEPIPEACKLISFRQLPGGHAYYRAFFGRAVLSIPKTFGPKPEMLVATGKLLDGFEVNYGDCAVRLYSLPLVPIIVLLWTETAEFPASANMFFDASISHYLTTEQVAMLCELTSARFRHAYEALTNEQKKS